MEEGKINWRMKRKKWATINIGNPSMKTPPPLPFHPLTMLLIPYAFDMIDLLEGFDLDPACLPAFTIPTSLALCLPASSPVKAIKVGVHASENLIEFE